MGTDKSLQAGTELRSQITTYTIERVLGSGGFGITYLASTSMKVGSIPVKYNVAIKEHFLAADCDRQAYSQSISYSQPSAQRVQQSCRDFIAEARRLRDIAEQQPNIVRVNEVFEANGTAYYVMEYLEGESLRDLIKRQGPMSEEQMKATMRPIIEATAFLHRNNITHLDIKPGNIMLSISEGGATRPVLIDFGLSMHYDENGTATSTIGVGGITDGYAPVEQYAGIRTFSPTADVYALAATMVYVLTGTSLPAASMVTPETLQAAIPASVSPELRRLLIRSLSYIPAERPADASQLLAQMEGASADESTQIASEGATQILTPEATAGGKKKRLRINPQKPSMPEPPTVAPPAYQQPYQQPQQKSSSKTSLFIAIGIIGFLLVGGIAAAVLGKSSRESNSSRNHDDETELARSNDDDNSAYGSDYTGSYERPVEVETEEETAYAAAPTSGRAYYDQIFNDIRPGTGVRTITWHGNTFTYDSDGRWTNPSYADQLQDRTWEFSGDGRRTVENYYSDEKGYGQMVYDWRGDKIVSIRDDLRGYTVVREYDSDGNMTESTTYYDDSSRSPKYHSYSGYKFDSHGNWISRKTGGNTETRTISYY